MDERMPKSDEFEEWVKELLPDGPADIGMWQQQPERSSITVERPNTSQLSVDSHAYPRNLSQHQLMQHTSAGFNSTPLMAKREQEPLQKILEPRSGMVLERAHPRLQMPSLHQSQNLTLAGNQTQAMLLGHLQASLESAPQVDMTTSLDWFNPAYHKIMQIKEMCLSQYINLHHKMQELKRQATDAETANKWEKNRRFIEGIIRFLNQSKQELLQMKREKIYQMINDSVRYISQVQTRNSLYTKQTHQVEASGHHIEAPQIQQRENHLHFNTTQGSLHQPLIRPGGTPGFPQSSLNSFKIGSSAGSSTVNSYQYNMMRPLQPWAPQGSMAPSQRKGTSQVGHDPRALRMLLHPSSGVSQYNNLGASQQTVASSRNIFNSLDYSMSPMAQPPISMPPLQNNQQDQAMKRQKMKQPVQQLMNEKNKQQLLQKRNEDTKLRRFVGINQIWSPVLPPSTSPYAISPQNSQQSSPQFELKELPSKFSKSATPSLSSASPSALPSPLTPMTPLTPLTPSSMPADCVKSPLIEESIKLAKNPVAVSQPPLQDTNSNQLSTDTQRSTKSCLQRESASSGDKQSSKAKGDPLKRLIEVVKSVSSKALRATIRDISAVTSFSDMVAGNFREDGKPTKVIFYDLDDDMVSNCGKGTGMKSGLKRELDIPASYDFSTDTKVYASGSIKRLKTEKNNLLLEEIEEINEKLIEVVVDVMTLDGVSKAGSDEGTLIRCSYIPVGSLGNIKIPNTQLMFPNLLLDLLVSADYPNSSPTVLEKDPSGFCDAEEGRYMWMKAKTNFILSLRKLSEPMSVKVMAEAWDVCAREVFHELADHAGGGSFSSTYGKWESCAVAV